MALYTAQKRTASGIKSRAQFAAYPVILRATDFSDLPDALIMTANYHPLKDEGKAYTDKLQSFGVKTSYQNYENVHGFLGLGKMGEEVLETASNFLKEKLKVH
ncbi:alpha/beta hydrolase [Dyadobacter sp. 3J3]|uniref:alpha/beta hydrolase n=1 Tax=Dyadobacter sp. 3J3 TaxID=2606600 RepID=UPI00210819DE|nr:alpha/beta hydrolase fold domain-containing protein [Dyadobacter sp. 3J3]